MRTYLCPFAARRAARRTGPGFAPHGLRLLLHLALVAIPAATLAHAARSTKLDPSSHGTTLADLHGGPTGAPRSSLVGRTGEGWFAPPPYADGGSILLGNGFRFDPVTEGEPDVPAELQAAPPGPDERGGFLV